MRYSYTYNTGNTEYKLRVAGIKGRHQKAICWFCDSSNEGRLTARERSKRFAGMIVRPWEVSQTMSQLLTDAPRDLPCNISCRKSHCMATGEDRTIAKWLPYPVTHCTDLTKAFFIVRMPHSFMAQKGREFYWCVWKRYGLPCADVYETRTRLAATRAAIFTSLTFWRRNYFFKF